MLQPRGPLPPSTYWRRRGVLLLVLVVLVVLGLKACTGGGGDGRDAAVPPVTNPTTGPTTDPTTNPTTDPTASAPLTTTAPPPAAPGPAVPGLCPDAGLTLTASTSAPSYPLGTTARLTMALTNTGTVPCTRGVGQGALSFTVTSGADRIWSSDDCSPGGAEGPEVLAPGVAKTVTLPWSLARSQPGCPGGRPALKAGTYTVTARAGTLTSAPTGFSLTGA